MLLLTGGFVLGEVVILHQSTMRKLAPFLAAALLLCVAAVCADRHRKQLWGRSLGLKLLPFFIVLGIGRGFWEERTVLAEQKLAIEAESIYGVGEISEITDKESWVVLLLKNVQTEKGELRYLQVYAERNEFQNQTEYRIGDVVRVWGEFTQFQPASNPGEFDYAAYYRGQKLIWRVFALTVRRENPGERMDLVVMDKILRLRMWAADRLKLLAGEEDGSIFAAMILGDKADMSEEIRDLYQKNGIAHLLAVSGLHLSMVSMAAYGMLRKAGAGYGKSAVAGSLILIFYSILTGASPSVLRALIMTMCGFLAAYLGRTYDLLSAMGLSAFLLLWHSPYLMDQAGVQLSFAAIGGIGLAKELEERGGSWAEQTLRLTLCMQLVSLPVVLWHFFSYPLYGIFLNLLVVPLTGMIVGSGAGSLLASLFAFRVGRFLTGGGRAVLAWYAFCCRCFMKLPGSSLLCGRPELWQIALYYTALGLLVYGLCRKRKGEMMMAFFLTASLFFLRPPAVRGLEVTILDTGQGDGICIRTKNEVILVDGGSTDQKELGKYRLEPFLRSKGIRQIDLAVVSHGDWDHISGLSWLMEAASEKANTGTIFVQTLVMPEVGRGEEVYERLGQLCEKQGGTILWMARGDCWKNLRCIYPEADSGHDSILAGADRNEHSLVLRLDYGTFHMLLTGDMSAKGEERLMQLEESSLRRKKEEFWVLKTAHHGSGYSSSEEFLDWLRPDYAVISCGKKNRYGHPHPETIKRLSACGSVILKTEESGAVIWKTDGHRSDCIEWKENDLYARKRDDTIEKRRKGI